MRTSAESGSQQTLPILAAGAAAAVTAMLWLGAASACVLTGHRPVRVSLVAPWAALAHPARPSAAWGRPVGPAVAYWSISAMVLSAAAAGALWLAWYVSAIAAPAVRAANGQGMASRPAILRAAGARALVRRSAQLRPALQRPHAQQVGVRLGSSSGIACWASVEDSILILGPPRCGKGLHLVIPMILDAPGAVVTTSTRPDNVTATLAARSEHGPVAVFDPQALMPQLAATTRWSPMRGCESAPVAMSRARALCADPGDGVENGSFWSQQCTTAVRCMLHAAAIGGRTAAQLRRWSVSPEAAEEAVDILAAGDAGIANWRGELDAILTADPRQRDATWSTVANVFACLADPTVLEAVSPQPGQGFDPHEFLRTRGTLYLLGTASGASATSNVVAALVDDVIEAARSLAAASPGARLDPPLAAILDEAANYPLAALPALMSEGGGSGISTTVVLQSLAQARARWGEHDAQAIWDAAIVKVLFGGSANAGDLRDVSALTGTRLQRRTSASWGPDGRRTTSVSDQDVAVLDVADLRTVAFGRAVLLLRSVPPIALKLRPWTARHDATSIADGRRALEHNMRNPDRPAAPSDPGTAR